MPDYQSQDELIERARLAAERADTLRAGLNQLDRQRKIILAEEKLNAHKTATSKLSEARAEDMARASRRYAQHCADMEEAEKLLASAEAEKWAAVNAVQLMLSREATAREEMRQYGPDAKPRTEKAPRPDPPLGDFVPDDPPLTPDEISALF